VGRTYSVCIVVSPNIVSRNAHYKGEINRILGIVWERERWGAHRNAYAYAYALAGSGYSLNFRQWSLEHSALAYAGHLGWNTAATPGMRNEKGRSHDLPFSLNKFRFCAVIAVQQRCRIRLFGRFLPKLRPPSRAAFFCTYSDACQLLIVPTFLYPIFAIKPNI
jgi:hypothetical protein